MNTSVTVQEVMDRAFVGVSESDSLPETVELMVEDGVDCVVVIRGQDPVGILTQRNVLERLVSGDFDTATVADAMTEAVRTIDPDVTLSEAASELAARTTQRLVVTDGDEPVGVLSEHDVLSISPFDREGITETDESRPIAATAGEENADVDAAGTSGFEEQSICEACGSFVRDLVAINGQLLCADCRDI